MQNGYPKVVIVILNWNGLVDTLECLRSIKKITYPNFKIVVVDNGSKDKEAEVIRKTFGHLVDVIREEENIGFAAGCNVGICWGLRLGARYILLLNNDTIVDPNFLTELINISESDPRIGIVGPKVRFYERPELIYSAGGKVNLWTGSTPNIGFNEHDDGRFDNIDNVDYIIGCAFLIKREAIETVGLLHEKYFAYYEEAEWCLKTRKAGFKVVYVPKSKIWHKNPDKKKDSANILRVYYLSRNRFLFLKRNSTSVQFAISTLYFLASDLVLLTKSKIFLNPLLVVAHLKGVCKGLIMLRE